MLSITNIIAIVLLLILFTMFFSISFEIRSPEDDSNKCIATGSNTLRYLSDSWSGQVSALKTWMKSPPLETASTEGGATGSSEASAEQFNNYRGRYHGEFY